MIKNYFIVALRNLKKHKVFTAVNIVGLTVAFTSSILIFLVAYYDLSFDGFHTNKKNIYRLYFTAQTFSGVAVNNAMPYPLMPALKAEFPEVKFTTRLRYTSSDIRYNGREYQKNILGADPDLLNSFSFPMVSGSASTALSNLSNIVISQTMAKTIFGAENPINKTVQLKRNGEWQNFIVSGIVADNPENSSIEYDAFIRIETDGNYLQNKNKWNSRDHEVYIQLAENTVIKQFEKKMQGFLDKYEPPDLASLKKNKVNPDTNGNYSSLLLTPLTDVHFFNENTGAVNKSYDYTLLLLAFFIMLIASINFINLSISRSFTRAKEVGVRKSIGANRGQLFLQIWIESLLICFIAFVIGLLIAYFLLPSFRTLFNTELPFPFIVKPFTIILMAVSFLLVSVISGGYPALIMSGFNTIKILKGNLFLNKRAGFRNGLIILQFSIAILLICCTIIVLQQVSFLRNMPLGFNQNQVISMPINTSNGSLFIARLRNEFTMEPNVVAVSGSDTNIGTGLDHNSGRSKYGFDYKDKYLTTDWLYVDFDYLKTLDIKLTAGRDFDKSFGADSTLSVIVNESMAKQMGDSIVAGQFIQPDTSMPKIHVVGVVPDFHLFSLHEKIVPLTIQIGRSNQLGYALIRVKPGGMVAIMDKVKIFWKSQFPDKEFQGSFLDENTNRWYAMEQRQSKIYTIAAAIAIIISCMGLFAISLLMIEQRIKEIGVRKSLGASVQSIVGMLCKEFIKLVLVAIIIASPIAWFIMSKWLNDFPYRINIGWWVFVVTGILAIVIALLTVSYQSIKVALVNPVKSLRSE